MADTGTSSAVYQEENAHRVLVKNPTCTTARENFRALRRQSKILNSKARSEYYQHLFNSVRTKPRLHWKRYFGGTKHIIKLLAYIWGTLHGRRLPSIF